MVWALPRSLATTGGIIVYFLFLEVLRCFSSLRSPPTSVGYHVFNMVGCPIRKSRGQRSFAPHPGLSQLITSFIACESQGIRHAPFITFSHKKLGRIYFQHLSCDLLTLLSISSFAFAPTCQRSLREYGFCQLSTVNSQLTMSSRMGVHRSSNAVPK